MTKIKIRIASRKSTLAMIQANNVASILKYKSKIFEPEIIGISTKGDEDKKSDLKTLNDIGFFTKEIDNSLLNNKTDIAVHCQKDVGTQRPDGLKQLAVLDKQNPRDILILNQQAITKLENEEEIIIGSSSPRRELLIPEFLENYLPYKKPRIKLANIRGNIETRLSKTVHKNEEGFYFDGICLAAAGLTRYLENADATSEVEKTLSRSKLIMLPVNECPGAAGQGVLYIESKSDFKYFDDLKNILNNTRIEKSVSKEREILRQNGGGCHQPFGVSCLQLDENIQATFVKGKNTKNQNVTKTEYTGEFNRIELPEKVEIFDAAKLNNKIFERKSIAYEIPQNIPDFIFITKFDALTDELIEKINNKRIWCPGLKSWQKFKDLGLFVEGCTESLGFDNFKTLIDKKPFGINKDNMLVLTHKDALDNWFGYNAIATYELKPVYKEDLISEIKRANVFFWSSFNQYNTLKQHLMNKKGLHFCGLGKTLEKLKKEQINVKQFPNYEYWKKWIQQKITAQNLKEN